MIQMGSTALEAYASLTQGDGTEIDRDLAANGMTPDDLRSVTFQTGETTEDVILRDASGRLDGSQLIFVGVRLGVPFLLGANATYLRASEGRIRFHFDADASTTVILSDLSVGVGYHPNGGAFYIGGRLHRVGSMFILSDSGYEWRNGAGVEIGWTRVFGQQQRGLFTARIGGAALSPDENANLGVAVVPDVAIGVSLRVFRH